MKVIITGASGFVGKNLLSYLNHDIVYVNRESLTDPSFSLINSGDVIIHLAGKAHDLKSVSQPEEYYQVNYELTKKLYNAFLSSNVKKFIFISSVKAVADSLNSPLTEDHTPDPQTHYGKSKLMAEEYITAQQLPGGRSYYILRPCMIHGPGNKGNLNLLYNLVAKGIPYPLATLKNERSFLSVKNLCFVIQQIIERDDIPTGIYNVADDEPLSTNELIKVMGAASKKKVFLWHIPIKLMQLAAKMGDKLKLPLNTERLGKLTENYVVDNTKIKNALKKPLPVQVREGIAETVKSFALVNSKLRGY